MIKICVVGSIGSGKTHVSKLLAGKSNPLFNADLEVAKIYKKNKNIYQKIKKIFPKYISSFPINKNELIQIILQNKKNIKKIINIIHPVVRKKLHFFLEKNKKKKIVILDIPLLLENKLNLPEDIIVYIDPKKTLLEKKLKQRAEYNKKMINILNKIQLPVEEKKKISDFIIINDYNKKKMILRTKAILDKIILND